MTTIYQIGKDEINSFSKFVLKEYYERNNCGSILNEILAEKLQEIYKEDLDFFDNSKYYLAKRNDQVVGSIRVTKWDGKQILPIQRLFEIDPRRKFPDKLLWHVGRFAVSQEPGINTLFKKLMVCAVAPIYFTEGSVMLAECDLKLVKAIELLDIEVNIIGKPFVYLYSETVPIAIHSVCFERFIKKHAYLCHQILSPIK